MFFRETIRKRLIRTTFLDNERDYKDKSFQAAALFHAFLQLTELSTTPVPYDSALMEACIYENEFIKLTKKTQKVLANNANRSRPDWKLNFVDHFVKSQLKGKLEAVNAPGKAGQTIATCSDLVVLLFGPMVRYLRAKVMNSWPDNLYCNCGKSLADQSRWAARYWRDVPSTTSDYTAFDASQRGDSLGFEYALMRHFGLQESWLLAFELHRADFADITECYLDWKLHTTSSVVGEKRTGRDSGEPGTYDFNTYFSMAVYQLMYSPPRGTDACFGGDDLAANADLHTTPLWSRIANRFDIIAKVLHTERPEFCGYYLTSQGCFKNPEVLMLKTLWHLDKGDADVVDVNYAAEATGRPRGHRKTERPQDRRPRGHRTEGSIREDRPRATESGGGEPSDRTRRRDQSAGETGREQSERNEPYRKRNAQSTEEQERPERNEPY